jgi:hypothetical protein
MKTALAIASLVFACSLPQPGWAQQKNLDKAVIVLEQQARAGRGEFVTFLTGAATAYRWISTEPQASGAQPAYCPPAQRTLDGRAYARIAIDEYKRARSEYAKVPEYPLQVLTLALLRGLAEQFPCKAQEAAEESAVVPGPSASGSDLQKGDLQKSE